MPKKGRGKSGKLDPLDLPSELQTALHALYGHYGKVFEEWKRAGVDVPPVFIVVCNNTSTSQLVYEWISGWDREEEEGERQLFYIACTRARDRLLISCVAPGSEFLGDLTRT